MRLSWIDEIKGAAIISVVLGHAAMWIDRGNYFDAYIGEYIFDILYAFHMPLFFMISGYLYEMTWNESGRAFSYKKIENKFMNLFSIYILFSVLWWMPKYITGFFVALKTPMTLSNLLLIFISPIQHMWFLWVLSILFFVIPLLMKWLNHRGILLGIFGGGYFILYTWNFLDSTLLAQVPLIFYGGLYFILGSWIRNQHWDKMLSNNIVYPLCISTIICIINIYSYFNGGGSIAERVLLMRVAVALSGIYLFCYFFRNIWQKYHFHGEAQLQRCGKQSLEIYLLHGYFVSLGMRLFNHFYEGSSLLALLITTFVAVFISLQIGAWCNKNTSFQYLFNPIKMFRRKNK